MGCPTFPFIGQERARITDGRKEKKPEAKEVRQGRWVFLYLCAGPADMADDDRDCPLLGAYLLILIGLCERIKMPKRGG